MKIQKCDSALCVAAVRAVWEAGARFRCGPGIRAVVGVRPYILLKDRFFLLSEYRRVSEFSLTHSLTTVESVVMLMCQLLLSS